jgi:hypothetical protein
MLTNQKISMLKFLRTADFRRQKKCVGIVREFRSSAIVNTL